MKRNEVSLRDLWNNIKYMNIRIIGVPEENRKRERTRENIWRIAENFPNLEKEIINQVQEAQNPRQDKSTEEHIETHSNQNDKN